MPQVVECGDCGKKLRAADELAGLKVLPAVCESIVRVPAIRPLVSDLPRPVMPFWTNWI